MVRPTGLCLVGALVALLSCGCFNGEVLKRPCPEGTAHVLCDGQAFCAPAGISSCNPNQVPLRN